MKTLLTCCAALWMSLCLQAAEAYYWPSSPRTPAKLQEQWTEFDRITMKMYTVNLTGAKIEVPYLGKFGVGEHDGKWNVTFVLPEQPSVRVGMVGFYRGDFLPSGSPASVLAYQEGLKARGATQVRSTADGSWNEELMIAGVKPEAVEYVLEGTKTREYILEIQGRIFVFGYQAPVKIFEAQADVARIIFARMRFLSFQG